MQTIRIHFPPKGAPTITPSAAVCLSEETLVFEIYSENPYIEAVNLAFDDTAAKIFCCPDSAEDARKHHCMVQMAELKNPTGDRTGVTWGISLENYENMPKELKYSIIPYVFDNEYKEGTVDPWIIITKRPVAAGSA